MKSKTIIKQIFNIIAILTLGTPTISCLDTPEEETSSTPAPSEDDTDNENAFPQLMAFRAENTLGHGVTTGLEDYDIIHTGSQATIEAMINSDTFSEKKIIYHGAHAAISSDFRSEVFPGHWLFTSGTIITKSINTTATTFKVEKPDVFVVGDHAMISYRNKITQKRDWDTVEEVLISSIDSENSKITVKRGQNETSPVAWSTSLNNTEIVITPHVYQTTTDPGDAWQINVSLNSPVNPDTGETGYEFYAKWVYEYIWVGIMQEKGDGIQLDSGRWGYFSAEYSIDTNNDGTPDYGFVNGVNVYGLGSSKYIKLLREKLPHRAILQIDSNTTNGGYRNPNDINGIEMESFPNIENYDYFGNSFIHLRQFVSHAEFDPMSYPFTKDDTELYQCDPESAESDTSEIETNSYFRIGFATALLLGMPYAYAPQTDISGEKCFGLYAWDEYFGGNLNQTKWLGEPKSEALQYLDNLGTSNLIESSTWTYGDKNNLTMSDNDYVYTVSTQNNILKLDMTKVPEIIEVRVNNAFFPSVDGIYFTTDTGIGTDKANEFTISFKSSGTTTYNNDADYSEFTNIPRLLVVKILADGEIYRQSVLVWKDEQEFLLNFKTSTKTSVSKVTFESGEETGSIKIKNPSLHTGSPEHWIRYFENGAIILNMSDTDWEVTLDTTYSSQGFQRLNGIYDTEINNGNKGNGTSKNTFTIPARDALVVKNISN